MINWQVSKQGIRWPVSPDRTAGSSVDPSRSNIFWSYPLINYQFQMIAGSSLFFPRIYILFMSLWPRIMRILISSWPRKRKFHQFFKSTGEEDLILPWSRSTSNFYTLIGQNLTGEFMRTNYAASWKLFTLTAEADRILCQLVIFLTVFFLWMYKMKYSCYRESSVIHGWFVYWVFGWEMRRLSKFGNSFLDGIVFVFHLA